MSVDSDGERFVELFAAMAAIEGGSARVDDDEGVIEAAAVKRGTARLDEDGAVIAAAIDGESAQLDEDDTDLGVARAVIAAAIDGESAQLDEDDTDLGAAGEGGHVPAHSRKVAPRSRTRRDRPRSKTIALKRLTRAELARGAELYPPIEDLERPQTREDCRDAPRPCPWVACKHHLYLDINPRTGSIKLNFPDLEPWELPHTCALDVADSGGLTLEEIGLITNLTRERVRQVEVRGLLTLKARSNALR